MRKKGLIAKEEMKKKKVVVEDAEKWLKCYSSDHQILLVGEGDFSFSLSLARCFGSASNIVASSLDSYDDVIKKYKEGISNLYELKELGACLLHGVDTTKMKLHPDLKMWRFDRVIFNFPHAGFHGKEDNHFMIMKHRCLVREFFVNARCLLRANGEIHVNHKTTSPYSRWRIDELASESSLTLIERVDFKKEDYPGYNNKRGNGSRCDKPFPLGKCSTFKFIHNYKAMEGPIRSYNAYTGSMRKRKLPFPEIKFVEEQIPTSVYFDNHYPHMNHTSRMNEALSLEIGSRNENCPIIGGYSKNVADRLQRAPPDAGFITHRTRPDLQRSFQPLPPPINFRYPPAYHVGLMDMEPLSLSARNEPYHVFGSSSSYSSEELGRRVRPCFERHIAEAPAGTTSHEVPRRTLNRIELLHGRTSNGDIYAQFELHHMSTLRRYHHPDQRVNGSAVKEFQYW